VLFTFSTYVTIGFWGAFCWLKLIRKIYKCWLLQLTSVLWVI
jgi:hypothetical protein